MVDRNTNYEALTITLTQFQEHRLTLVHRLHRVRKYDCLKSAGERIIKHCRQIRIYKRFTTGESDKLGAKPVVLNLVKILPDFLSAQIN